MIFAVAVQPINVPDTLLALAAVIGALTALLAGLIPMWVSLHNKLSQVGVDAKASADKTDAGNEVLDKVQGLIQSKGDEAKAREIADLRQAVVLASVKSEPAPSLTAPPIPQFEPVKVIVDSTEPVRVEEVPPDIEPDVSRKPDDPTRPGFHH